MKSLRKYWYFGVAAITMGTATPALANIVTSPTTAPTTVAAQISVVLHIHFKSTPSSITSTTCIITLAPSNDSFPQSTSKVGSVVQTSGVTHGDCSATIPFEWHVGATGNFNCVVTYHIATGDNPQRVAEGTAAFFQIPIAGGTGSISANVGY